MSKRIITIGDSIVYGRMDPVHGGWAGRLRSWYLPQNPEKNAVFNLGVGGENTTELLRRFKSECEIREPDLILICIGTNDFRQKGSPKADYETPPKLFQENLGKLFHISKDLSKATVFVGMVPVDESRTAPDPEKAYWRFLDAQQKYAKITKEVCHKHEVRYIDNITEWFNLGKLHFGFGKRKYIKLLDDGVHPNAEGHEFLFLTIKEFLRRHKYL